MGKVVVQNQDERNQQSAVVNTWQELGDCFFFRLFSALRMGINHRRGGTSRVLVARDSYRATTLFT